MGADYSASIIYGVILEQLSDLESYVYDTRNVMPDGLCHVYSGSEHEDNMEVIVGADESLMELSLQEESAALEIKPNEMIVKKEWNDLISKWIEDVNKMDGIKFAAKPKWYLVITEM